LSEFRGKVAERGLEQVVLDALLERLVSAGLVRAGGKQRTDSTQVTAAVAALNRLELAGESVRAAPEALAAAHPAWLEQRVCVPDFARRYGTPMTSWRPPASQARRDELAIAYARDGYALAEAVYDKTAPAWLRELPAVGVLRRVLLQNYTRTITGHGREVIRRREKEPEGDGLPPGHARIASPYDLDARSGVKREELTCALSRTTCGRRRRPSRQRQPSAATSSPCHPHRPARSQPHHPAPARRLAPRTRMDEPVRRRLRPQQQRPDSPDQVSTRHACNSQPQPRPRRENPDKPQEQCAAGNHAPDRPGLTKSHQHQHET
jgi:hypothetical protein